MRRRGTCASTLSRAAPSSSCVIAVSTKPGATGIHGDAAARELDGERLRQPDQARLRGRVVGLARVAGQPDHGRDVDDAAPALARHGAHQRARAPEAAGQVRLDHALPVLVAPCAWRGPSAVMPRVIDQDVDALADSRGHRVHRFLVADVEGQRFGAAAVGADLVHQLRELLGLASAGDDPGPARRERLGARSLPIPWLAPVTNATRCVTGRSPPSRQASPYGCTGSTGRWRGPAR